MSSSESDSPGSSGKRDSDNRPQHIAIVMDGNGRWAERRKRPRTMGHQAGLQAVRKTVEHCIRRNIRALTLFAFSSENWNRPAQEVNRLMDLFIRAIDREVEGLTKNGVRIRFIGDRSAFPVELQQGMERSEMASAHNERLHLNIAANYGGRWDIANATRQIARAVSSGEIDPDQIDTPLIDRFMSLSELPAPDLLIRTGGEFRISNFLLWQIAYTELYFSDLLWPEFDADALDAALNDFSARQRRFGRTSAQLATASGER